MSSEVLISIGCVGLGGAIGAFLRCFCTVMALKFANVNMWVGILLVNILGCFLIGLIAVTLSPRDNQPGAFTHFLATVFSSEPAETAARARLLLMTGICGGFTTFSTAMLDAFVMWRVGKPGWAAFNLFGTPLFSLVAVVLGFALGEML